MAKRLTIPTQRELMYEALSQVSGKTITRFQYRPGQKRRGRETIVLHFTDGKLQVTIDPTHEGPELLAWFTPKR